VRDDRRRLLDRRGAAALARAGDPQAGRRGGDGVRRGRGRDGGDCGSRRDVESDPERATIAAARLEAFPNVELLVGTWEDLLPPRAPFDLVFHDAGNFKRAPDEHGEVVVDLLAPGGLLVLDDLTPGRTGPDAIREWARAHPRLAATEILTTPETSALVIARR
jgi:SAM-dependent methyltransferase